jgi:hypothetical protein
MASLRNGERCRVVVVHEGAEFCPQHGRLAAKYGTEVVRKGDVPKKRGARLAEEAGAADHNDEDGNIGCGDRAGEPARLLIFEHASGLADGAAPPSRHLRAGVLPLSDFSRSV